MANEILDDKNIRQLIAWGEETPNIRAMILTSTLAIPGGYRDALSDYDVILIANDIYPFYESRDWLKAFGSVLALYRDPILTDDSLEHSGYVIQFEGDLKIDFTLWPVAMMQRVANAPTLTDELDAGYVVLLDKDVLTSTVKPPSYKGYVPAPPPEAQFLATIENFFLDTTYVAKYLWRDDMMAAKHIFHNGLRHDSLLPMLEWHMEIDHDWQVKPGPYGRRLKQWLRPDLWAELEGTYVGIGIEENWNALYKMIALFERVAKEVGNQLGFTYPEELQQRAMIHLNHVKNLDPQATSFSGSSYV